MKARALLHLIVGSKTTRRSKPLRCPGTEGDRRLEGILEKVDDFGLVVRIDDGSYRAVAYEEIQTARTVFAWEQLPEPARQGGRGAAVRNEGNGGP